MVRVDGHADEKCTWSWTVTFREGEGGAAPGTEKLFCGGNGGIAGWVLVHGVDAKVEAVAFRMDVINVPEAVARVEKMETKQRLLAHARSMGNGRLLDAR